MKSMLTATPLQLFSALAIVPAIGYAVAAMFMPDPTSWMAFLILFLPWYGWVLVIGTNLMKISGRCSARSILRFQLTIILVPIAWILFSLMNGEHPAINDESRVYTVLALLYVGMGTFAAFIQLAKAFTAAMGQPADRFNDYAGNFLTLWSFPFSTFWFLQRKSRQLFLKRFADTN